MKKGILILGIIAFGFLKTMAQSFQILDTTGAHGGNGVLAQTTYNFTVDTSNAYGYMFNVKNTTSSAITVKVKKRLISNAGNDIITFCVGVNCYPATTTLSAAVAVSANQTLANGFLTDFTASNVANTAKVIYTIYNANATNDSVTVTINYNILAIAGIKTYQTAYNVSNISPNPASNSVSIAYDFKNSNQAATLKIYNMLGALVKTVTMDASDNTVKADVSSLDEGAYFYSVILGGKVVKTSRLIISR